jgi:cellulose 1,4-beta-cellobiosidase
MNSDLDFSRGGQHGSCCAELDIWNANTMATSFAVHGCRTAGSMKCTSAECEGLCDTAGCDYNPYRMGSQFFYGPGKGYALDTTKPFTVVTQFITVNGDDISALSNINRFYIQNGKTIINPDPSVMNYPSTSLSDSYCTAKSQAFSSPEMSAHYGGLASIGAALERGVVLTFSLSGDSDNNMLWLDGDYPSGADPSSAGVSRGICPSSSGRLPDIRRQFPDAAIKFTNLKYGPLGSTSNPEP